MTDAQTDAQLDARPEPSPDLRSERRPVAVVTGGTAGIGRATALALARRGADVVLTYNSRPADAEETVAAIRALGGRAAALHLDIGRSESFPAFAGEVAALIGREWGAERITALVHNAGFGGGRTVEQMTEDDFDQYYRVLLRGPYFLTQTLLPMIADGATIVGVSSSSVRPGETEAGYSGYAAMKAGLVVAARHLARELSPRGIRVNTIAPGPTRTRIGDDAFARYPEIAEGIAARTALGRVGEPEDIAGVIAFLTSDDAAWITGQDLQVAGGYAL